jgi:phosphate transport system ATP-binding protein
VTSQPHLIRVRDLEIHYGRRQVLGGVDLDIPQGRITGLVGPSGCGKTSFLMALNRLTDLLPNCRVEGEIRLGDRDTLAPRTDLTALRRRIGMIFQKPSPFPFSIARNLELPLREHGLRSRTEIADRIETSLRDVGLWEEVKDRLGASALQLSGGQQQRLCLARALVLEPEVLLLDEPCSALDPFASGVVEDLIGSLRDRLTLVVVTHNLAQARRIADQVAVFWTRQEMGYLVESGSAEQIFETPREAITRAYISGQRG